jgi:hypothetical protein
VALYVSYSKENGPQGERFNPKTDLPSNDANFDVICGGHT